jgi:hypothetical protein
MMILKRLALPFMIFFLSFISSRMVAQPMLPDIGGSVDKGIVLLTWNCQLNAVKSIAVMRSADSLSNYSIVGNVKKIDKGVQAFADAHPASGKNFYKLSILFNSGLSWTSNRVAVYVDKAALESARSFPSNDSLQRYIVTENAMGKKGKPLINNDAPVISKNKVCITFGADTATTTIRGGSEPFREPAEKVKIDIAFDNPDVDQPIFIRSRFVFTDPLTGHVTMKLPDDVKQHHYSIKFYDIQKHIIVEIPRINASNIILDKRNFQKRGVLRFVLRKDAVELESGYVTVN